MVGCVNLTPLPKGQMGPAHFACVMQAVDAAVAFEASGKDGLIAARIGGSRRCEVVGRSVRSKNSFVQSFGDALTGKRVAGCGGVSSGQPSLAAKGAEHSG